MMKTWGVIAGGILLLCSAFLPVSDAITITADTANSESMLGDFTADFTYMAADAMNATLTVILTNENTTAAGGKITGFAFNNPDDKITGVTLGTTDPDFLLQGGPGFNDGVPGPPFGDFDIAAALEGNLTGGGSPNPGIAIGDTETFTFTLTGTMLDMLDEQSFVDELSANPGGGGSQFFVVRFRGFDNGGSDKVPGTCEDCDGGGGGGGGGGQVPEPSTVLLFGSGLAALALMGRKKWRTKK